MIYIFWPNTLTKLRAQDCVVIGLCCGQSDLLVLLLASLEVSNKISQPYRNIGVLKTNGEFECHLDTDDYSVVMFRPPNLNLMQFYSLKPISLILPDRDTSQLFESKSKHMAGFRERGGPPSSFRDSLNEINLYHRKLEHFYRVHEELRLKSEKISSSRSRLRNWLRNLGTSRLISILHYLVIYFTVTLHFIASGVSSLLNKGPVPLVNVSVTAQQMDLRCQQVCYLPIQFLRIYGRKSATTSPPLRPLETNSSRTFLCEMYPDYIRFYNTLWLVVNDICFGLIIGALLRDNRFKISAAVSRSLEEFLYKKVRFMTVFLGDNPFGIKLNGELAKFLSELFQWIIDFSHETYISTIIRYPSVEFMVDVISGICSLFGANFALSLIADLVSLLSMHISLFYFISARIYNWQLNLMLTLFYLFCGKKRNVLRKRVDGNMFQLDQLLMGTLFFTVNVFLLPTVAIFYAFFTLLRIVILTLEVTLESTMAMLNHFPLFALLLRLKDPRRIPGGIYFHQLGNDGRMFRLENKSLSLRSMFKPFSALMSYTTNTYISSTTLARCIVGLPILVQRRRMYQTLYFSLPTRPETPRDLWNLLKTTLP
ncbi:LAMI_0G02696g1_1 [Lachancea mirantina]|uniref:LAMI_0G02696g1_1 n=1 Tax=Lachancea mirantina TaxID=1230905 RepID=A0A1G4K7V3_9SACH|nr:LAMI_0G02696g1_1 [Lachancea mirantina]